MSTNGHSKTTCKRYKCAYHKVCTVKQPRAASSAAPTIEHTMMLTVAPVDSVELDPALSFCGGVLFVGVTGEAVAAADAVTACREKKSRSYHNGYKHSMRFEDQNTPH